MAIAQSDTTTFTYKEYLTNILFSHPVAKQANLKLDMADAEWLAAKGNFDPVLKSSWTQKNFKDKLYYRQFDSKVQIPTKLGIDVVAGYENTDGVYLNPENKTDAFGLWSAGLEVNLLQGLWVNERRMALKQAKIYRNIATNQQRILVNELLYEASIAYLDWQQKYYIQSVIQENITIAERYLNNTKLSFQGGEKTAIDTLEALLILQDAKALLLENEASLTKSKQKVENYLWLNNLPVELPSTTQPENQDTPIFELDANQDIANIVKSHPQILEKQEKQRYYETTQLLKKEKLKPKLKAKYNALLATSSESIAPNYSLSNYKWGFDFSFPLFLRSERADIQKNTIKIQTITFDIQNKQNELQNKIENSLQQQVILMSQLQLLAQNVEGYKRLLDAENEKFKYGESSVFLLNKRQEKYINGQIKLIKLNYKFQLELLNYLYYTNGLN